MPFLETFDEVDIEIVDALTKVAAANPEGLSGFLTLYESRGGVVNTDVYGAKIAAVEGGIGEIGANLNEMPWYVDGIDIRPGNAPPESYDANGQLLYWSMHIPRTEILESEDRVMAKIVEAVEDGHVGTVAALTDRDWMHPSVDALEFEVVNQVLAVAPNYDLPNPGIAGMPFLDVIGEFDIAALSDLEELSELDPDHESTVTSGPFDGGITDISASFLQFAILQSLSPEAANAVGPTLESEDTLSPSEHYTVRILSRLAKDNEVLLNAILEKDWAQDGFTIDESDLALELLRLNFFLEGQSDYPLSLLDMPFLDDVDPFDKKAVEALNELHWLSVTRTYGIQNLRSYVADHQAFADGITDSDVLKLSVLDDFANRVRRFDYAAFDQGGYIRAIDELLQPGSIEIEEDNLRLPGGESAMVRIIRPTEVIMADKTIEELTELLEFHIPLVGVSLDETDYTVVAVAGWGDAHARGEPLKSEDATTISGSPKFQVEVAATTLEYVDPIWLGNTFRKFGMYSNWNDGNPLTGHENIWEYNVCSQYRSILEALEVEQQRGRRCYLDAGVPLMSNLENNLSPDAFRDGMRAVYAGALEGAYRGYVACPQGSRGICQLWEGFVTQATPENAAIAARIINKWYYGSEDGYQQD